ncbi:MAG: hypothetical protein E6Y64_06510 [Enterobacter hormaechei]|nr:hypothetical protein [Enterobacter hormaechei]
MPAEPRERHQQRVVAQPFTGDTDIGPAVMQQHFDFLRRALDQFETYVREDLTKCFDNRRKTVARLCMGGGDSQHTGSVVGKEIRQPANVAGLVENALSDGQ